MSSNYRYIGKETPRKDARNIVTGKAQFFDDIKVPGMLYGKVLRSPHAHANITHIDVSRAKGLTGVRAVLTHKDVPPWEWGSAGKCSTMYWTCYCRRSRTAGP